MFRVLRRIASDVAYQFTITMINNLFSVWKKFFNHDVKYDT